MKILSLEASAKAAGVAVVDDKKVLGEFFSNTGLTHSQTILPMCQDVFKITDTKIQDIDAIAVSAGPGSFTGLRIAIAAAKGLAMAANKKCVAVSTLKALAYNVCDFDGLICPVMDARCSQVYNAFFDNSDFAMQRIVLDRAISLEQLKNEIINIKKSLILVGDGAQLCYNFLGNIEGVFLAPENSRFQRASSVALAAFDEPVCSPQELEPIYLRLPQAERERLTKENKK